MARKIAYAAMMAALAMIFSYIEALIPFSFGVPGIKLGLANLVVLVGLYFMEQQLVFGILITRIVLSGFLFANLSTLLYSLAGGIVSFGVMLLLKRIKGFFYCRREYCRRGQPQYCSACSGSSGR